MNFFSHAPVHIASKNLTFNNCDILKGQKGARVTLCIDSEGLWRLFYALFLWPEERLTFTLHTTWGSWHPTKPFGLNTMSRVLKHLSQPAGQKMKLLIALLPTSMKAVLHVGSPNILEDHTWVICNTQDTVLWLKCKTPSVFLASSYPAPPHIQSLLGRQGTILPRCEGWRGLTHVGADTTSNPQTWTWTTFGTGLNLLRVRGKAGHSKDLVPKPSCVEDGTHCLAPAEYCLGDGLGGSSQQMKWIKQKQSVKTEAKNQYKGFSCPRTEWT